MRTIWACVVVLGVVLAAHTAHADDSDLKSENVATGLSLAGSAIGPVMIFDGYEIANNNFGSNKHTVEALVAGGCVSMVIGPSLGEWYAGKGLTHGLKLRIGGALIGLAAAGLFVSAVQNDSGGAAGVGLIAGGIATGMLVVGTGDSLNDASADVREYNQTHRQLTLAPIATHDTHGLALVGTF
jgi:hypothetical protein